MRRFCRYVFHVQDVGAAVLSGKLFRGSSRFAMRSVEYTLQNTNATSPTWQRSQGKQLSLKESHLSCAPYAEAHCAQ
jgi:hypothetical protein